MDKTTTNALLSSGASVGSTLLSNYFANRRFDKEVRVNRENATIAYNRQLALLANQRSYDSPSAQMARYQAAGLHPGLVTGGLTAGPSPANVDQSAPSTHTNPSVSDFGSAFINGQSLALQARALDQKDRELDIAEKRAGAQNELDYAKAKEIFGETPLSKAEYEHMLLQNDLIKPQIETEWKRVDLMSEQVYAQWLENQLSYETFDDKVKKIRAEADIAEENAKQIASILTLAKMETAARIRMLNSQTGLNGALSSQAYSQVTLNNALTDKVSHEINEIDTRVRKLNSDIKLNNKELALKDALINYYYACATNQNAQAAFVAVQKAWYPVLSAHRIANDVANTQINMISAIGSFF